VSIHLLEGPFLNSSINREYQMALKALGVRAFPLPTEEPLPTQTQYSLDRHPGDLYVSAPEVLNAPGRGAVQAYACEWGELRLQHVRLHHTYGADPRPGRRGKLNPRLSRAARRTARAARATVLRCERDEESYVLARYHGSETYHDHVLPTFEVEEVLKP
jgi:ATP-dependent DNA helicase RecQ